VLANQKKPQFVAGWDRGTQRPFYPHLRMPRCRPEKDVANPFSENRENLKWLSPPGGRGGKGASSRRIILEVMRYQREDPSDPSWSGENKSRTTASAGRRGNSRAGLKKDENFCVGSALPFEGEVVGPG